MLRTSKIYWICQLLGWASMIGLETFNYTFFIGGNFTINALLNFILFAISGILVTHGLRIILAKQRVFEKRIISILAIALLSTFLSSIICSLLVYLPGLLFTPKETLDSFTFIYLIGHILNYGRYLLIWIIIYFLYKTLYQKNLVAQERLEAMSKAKSFELELLKKQVNPHFLFNALNSIKALVLIDTFKSREAIVTLSELLRYTLNYENKQLVTVNDEIKQVEKYLSLEKLRYGERLNVTYRIDSQTADEFIPSISIITMAENAIKHGLSAKAGLFNLCIEVFYDDLTLCIKVRNSGTISRKKNSDGIGLRNLRIQLKEHFGDNSTFILEEKAKEVHAIIFIEQNEYKDNSDRRRTSSNSRAKITIGEA